MSDIILSPHFKLSEFIKSNTATQKKIDNTPSLEVVSKLQQLCINVLEPLRCAFDTPVTIGSGYRCPVLNAAVGGVKNSQHMTGEAADLHVPSDAIGKSWFSWIQTHCTFDQLICERETSSSERWWIHVSFKSSGNRRQVISNLIKKK